MNSGETDIRVQIPTQAWLTSNILMDIDNTLINNPEISLKEYIYMQKAKTNIWEYNPEHEIYNIGYLLMMAYAFLVVPKESIEKNSLEVLSPEVTSLLSKIEIKTNELRPGLSDEENIIRHIRNSISHADFFIKSDNNIIFNDISNKKITFNGEVNISNFVSLLTEYFKAYYKIYYQKYIQH